MQAQKLQASIAKAEELNLPAVASITVPSSLSQGTVPPLKEFPELRNLDQKACADISSSIRASTTAQEES